MCGELLYYSHEIRDFFVYMSQPVKIFISYVQKDEEYKEELMEFLAPMRRQGVVEIWNDVDVQAGDKNREETIAKELKAAQIIILLVSPSLLNANDIYERELKPAIERSDRNEVVVVPVLIRPTDIYGTPLGKFQMIPRKFQSVSSWEDRDMAWQEVTQSLKRVVEAIQDNSLQLESPRVAPVITGTISQDIFDEARTKIAENKTEEVLKMLLADENIKKLDQNNGLILMYARFNSLNSDKLNGIISHADATLGFSQVNHTLLQMISILEKMATEYEQA